jgi:hypothetical protein
MTHRIPGMELLMARRAILLVALLVPFATLAGSPSSGDRNSPRVTLKDGIVRLEPSRGRNLFLLLANAATTSDDQQGFWVSHLGASLARDDVNKLSSSAKRTYANNIQHQRLEMKKICARKASLKSVDDVAGALTQFDLSNQANQEQLSAEAIEEVGGRLGKLLKDAGDRMNVHSFGFDHKKLMVAQKKDPKAHIDAFCATERRSLSVILWARHNMREDHGYAKQETKCGRTGGRAWATAGDTGGDC